MPEQHPVGGRQRQRVAGGLLPGQVLRPRHQLLALHVGELREAAVRRLVAPDPLARRIHRVAAVAMLVVAVVLVAVDDDLVADLPPPHLVAHRPDDPRSVRPGDMVVRLVHVERRDRNPKASPDAVIVDPRRHDEDQHLVGIDHRRVDHLELERRVRLAVPLAPDRPGVHPRRHMPQRRNLPDLVEILLRRVIGRLGQRGVQAHRVTLLRHKSSRNIIAQSCADRPLHYPTIHATPMCRDAAG